jgi:hypothetical protein
MAVSKSPSAMDVVFVAVMGMAVIVLSLAIIAAVTAVVVGVVKLMW